MTWARFDEYSQLIKARRIQRGLSVEDADFLEGAEGE